MKRTLKDENENYMLETKFPKSPRSSSSAFNDNNDKSTSNDIPTLNNRIKVCVRVRPLKPIELENNTKSIIDVIDKSMLVFDPIVYDEDHKYEYHGKLYKEIGKKAKKNLQFNFDRVFNDEENNLTVYSETTKDLVTSLLAGYNCSVFAYGSTGSGKTHTMLGSKNDPGVIFFTTMDLYKHIEEKKDEDLELKISYFEIYNEVIYDLLDPDSNKPLSILENANKSITVKNLTVHTPKNAEHLIRMLESGNKNRKQHPTDANSESSRSHAVFQITLQRKSYSDDQEMSLQVSKMSLIDLAGSERATNAYKTYRSDHLHREGGNINKSLLSLGNCIHALTTNKKDAYVPYRSSKLTLILRDSLGGNCQTLMIATISPSINQYEETHNTLIYAERAQGIQLTAHKNNITIAVQPRDYKNIIDNMTKEKAKFLNTINELKQEVELYKNRIEKIPENPITSSSDALKTLNSMKDILDELFQQRIQLRTKFLDCEHNLKILDYRLLYRDYVSDRLKSLDVISEESHTDQSKGLSINHTIHGQKLHYSNLKSSIEKEVEENRIKLSKFEIELLTKTNNDIIVRNYFLENHNIIEKKEMEFLQKHHEKMIEEFCSKNTTLDEITEDSINLNYRLYHTLNGLGHLSNEMDDKYSTLIKKIKGKKNVMWGDDLDTVSTNKTKTLMKLFTLTIQDNININNNNNGNNTPDHHHQNNLVAIRDITPRRLLRPIQQNHNGTPLNFGNTITKSRKMSSVINTPRQPYNNYREKFSYNYNNNNNNNNKFKNSKYYNHSMMNQLHWSSTSSVLSSQRKRQFIHNNNNYNNYNNHASNGSPFIQQSNNENFSYNPNFRPRFRF